MFELSLSAFGTAPFDQKSNVRLIKLPNHTITFPNCPLHNSNYSPHSLQSSLTGALVVVVVVVVSTCGFDVGLQVLPSNPQNHSTNGPCRP